MQTINYSIGLRHAGKVCLLLFMGLLLSAVSPDGPGEEIPLWANGAPGSEGKTGKEKIRITDQGDHVISNIHRPSITSYFPSPEKATGAAVIIAPGGGHRELWIDHEGYRPRTVVK